MLTDSAYVCIGQPTVKTTRLSHNGHRKPPQIHHASRRHRCGMAVRLARATTQSDADPVGNGLVESLARPGGNVTGRSLMAVGVT
jgi:hypothetical protein